MPDLWPDCRLFEGPLTVITYHVIVLLLAVRIRGILFNKQYPGANRFFMKIIKGSEVFMETAADTRGRKGSRGQCLVSAAISATSSARQISQSEE